MEDLPKLVLKLFKIYNATPPPSALPIPDYKTNSTLIGLIALKLLSLVGWVDGKIENKHLSKSVVLIPLLLFPNKHGRAPRFHHSFSLLVRT